MNDDTRHARRPVLCDCVVAPRLRELFVRMGLLTRRELARRNRLAGFWMNAQRGSVLRRGPRRFAADEAGWAAKLGVNFQPAVFAVDHVYFHPRLDVAD